jgi:ankyrin repeat protein
LNKVAKTGAIKCRKARPLCPVLLVFSVLLAGCAPSPHDLAARGKNGELRRALEKNAAGLVAARDRKEKTPLHTAVSCENRAAMEMLVKHGADMNATDITGMTPLHVAAMLGRAEEAGWLLDHGARRDERDSFGDTPVHTAAVFGQGGVIEVLAARGAPLNAPNSAGKTPVMLARDNRRHRVVSLLENLLAERAAAAPGGGT